MAISLKSMRYFCTAVNRGSISQAAEELNIAASAVSAAIDQVEQTLDLTLVTRQRSRGIEANASGRQITRKFERLLEDYQSILSEGADLKQALGGELRVGYYAPVAPAFLPEIFSSFLPPENDALLHLEECDNDAAQDGLLKGAYDVILFASEGAQAAIEFDVLIKAPAYCLLPASHPLARRASVSMAEIAKEPLVVLDRPVVSSYYHRLFEGVTNEIRVAAYANSTEMVRSLVSAGHGCAVLNMRPLTATSYSGKALVSLPIRDPLPPLTLAIAYDRSRPRRIVRHFVDACLGYFAAKGKDRCIVE
ncbi:LysR family transcriptional regulator [Lutimaribacter marinistellae]|uniref:LysR family transcriptional regulator n=1 Tax=Lutimaribacter marinistellae TaxID=1820329 RepID=A0ABV7TNP4_9RHOB